MSNVSEIITRRLGCEVLSFFSDNTTSSFLRLGPFVFPTLFIKKELSTFKISDCSDFMVDYGLPLGVFLFCLFLVLGLVLFFVYPRWRVILSSVLNQRRNET